MAVVIVAPFAPRGPAYAAHSTSEQSIVGAGLIDFTVQPNLSYTSGMRVRITPTASDAWMEGIVKTYAGTVLTVEVQVSNGGGGPYTDWNINLAGEPGIVPTYAGSATNALITETNGSGAATFHLKTLAGSDPTDVNVVRVLFPNGLFSLVSDSLLVTIANGTHLGIAFGGPFRVWLLLFNDNGVLKMGAIQTRDPFEHSIKSFPPDGIIPVSMFASEGATTGQVYVLPPLPTSPCPFVVLGFADYDTGLATSGVWLVSPNRIVMFGPGIKLPGDELQMIGYHNGAYQGFGSGIIIPMDNTLPQSSEGVPVLSQAIIPRCPMSVLEIEAQVMYNVEDPARKITAALFEQGVTSSRATIWGERSRDQLYIWSKQFANVTTSKTFSVNIGLDANGSFEFNGNYYGGSANSYLYITERQT